MGGENNNDDDGATAGASAVTATMMSGIIPPEVDASDDGIDAVHQNNYDDDDQNKRSNSNRSGSSNEDTAVEEDDHDDAMGGKGEQQEGGGKGKEEPPFSSSSRKDKEIEESLTPAQRAKRNVGLLRRASTYTSAYEESFFCCPIRFIGNFPLEWPRTSAIIFGVIVPLWMLIFLSAGFGILLANFEHDNEIINNDYILANRTVLDNVTSVEELSRLTLPERCFEDFFFIKNKRPFNNNNNNSTMLVNITNMLDHIKNCSDTYARDGIEYADNIWKNATSEGTAFQELTFNWNRCWPEELRKNVWNETNTKFIFYPNEKTVNYSRPTEQAETYKKTWIENQTDLYEKYLSEFPPNATVEEKFEGAFLRSVREATGRSSCILNVGGTAWFFFTVMTTIGYGNQAPETENGRMLIYTAGLVSLVLFGAVLAGSGFICTSIFDDFVSRFKWTSFLNNPWVGMVLWGGIWVAYAFTIAADAGLWWKKRLGDGADQFEFSRKDAVWFAYMSTSTVGLGDYYFQPEVMFGSDAMRFSFQFLVGFIFLANFLSKIKEAIESLLPTRKKYTLDGRLARTRLLACWNRGTGLKMFRRQIMGEEIESRTSEEKKEAEELKDDAKTLEPVIIQERVEELRAFLTEEQQEQAEESETEEKEEEEATENVGPVEAAAAAVAGIFGVGDDEGLSEEELALKLVQEEEAILRDLLLLVQEKHERLRLQTQQNSNPGSGEGDEEEGKISEQKEESPFRADVSDDADLPSMKIQESEEQEA